MMDEYIEETEDEDATMSEQQMLSVVRDEVDNALGWTGTRLTAARERNLEAWFGNRRGDEVEGRSQATSRVTFEQVEQILPGLLEVFVSSNEVCQFTGKSGADKDSAKAATTACNHVFRENEGMQVLTTMFRDALIQRNGIVKVTWDESNEGYIEVYEGKTVGEVEMLEQDTHFDFKEVTPFIFSDDGELVEIEEELMSQLPPEAMESVRFTVKGVRRKDDGRVVLENVPPEEFLINRDARGIDHSTARFLAHRIRTSVSDLIASGIDPDVAKNIPTSQPSSTTETAARLRSSQQDGNDFGFTDRTDSQRQVLVTECYTLIDTDGDGISEWWRILVGGEYAQSFISADPVDGHPFASVTPIPIPHRFYGLALADVVSDINEINTTLWRQYLDSLYLQTDPRTVVLSQGQGDTAVPMVNLEQLVDSTPGTYIEEYAPNALRTFSQETNAADMIPALSLHKEMLQARTGITPEGQGIDPNSINKTAYGVMVQQSAAAQRSTLIARVFADTGVKKIFNLIYKELLMHGTEMQVYAGGDWVEINPSDWATNLSASISVGLGHGTRMEKVSNLQTLGAVQEKLATSPGTSNMVTQENIFETAKELVEALGFKDPERFITDPATNPPKPPEQSAADKAVEAQQQIETMKLELDRQKLELERFEAMAKVKATELDHEVDVAKVRLAGAKLEFDEPWNITDDQGEGGTFADLLQGVDASAAPTEEIPGSEWGVN